MLTTAFVRRLVPLLAAAALLVPATSAFAATATDPGTVFATFATDLAAGNATAAAALLSPTVTWSAGPAQAYPPKFPLTATGLANVGALLAQEQTAKVTLKVAGTPTVSGDTVTFTADLSNPVLTTLGVASVKVDGTAKVDNGLITSVSTTVEAASAAALAKAYGAATAATTAAGATGAPALPKTGGSPFTWVWASLLLVAGGALTLFRRGSRTRA